MSFQRFVRKDIKPGWCAGCGLHTMFYTTLEVLNELDKKETVIVSGIGCSARGAAYFNLDTIHGMHGRAIPLAVGIKTGNENLNVIVFSGDGDLLDIGGNHLIHAARRNNDIAIICNCNEVFAMTGGQASATTKIGAVTATTPEGNLVQPVNIQGILLSNEKYFFARTSPMHKEHFKKCLKEAIRHKGFAFIEVVSPCLIDYERKTGKKVGEMFRDIKERYNIIDENRILKDNELGIVKSE